MSERDFIGLRPEPPPTASVAEKAGWVRMVRRNYAQFLAKDVKLGVLVRRYGKSAEELAEIAGKGRRA